VRLKNPFDTGGLKEETRLLSMVHIPVKQAQKVHRMSKMLKNMAADHRIGLYLLLSPKCWLFSIPRCSLSSSLDNTLLS
jgi:hypothetical protein